MTKDGVVPLVIEVRGGDRMNCVHRGEKHDWVFSPETTSRSARFTCSRCGCLGRYHFSRQGPCYIDECSSSSAASRRMAEQASLKAGLDLSRNNDLPVASADVGSEDTDEELTLFEQCVMRAGSDHRWFPPKGFS